MIGRDPSLRPLLDEWPWLERVASREASDDATADELMQEVLVRFHRNPPRSNEAASVRAWISVVARRILVDRLRSQARRESHERRAAVAVSPESACPLESTQRQDTLLRLRDAVDRLREPYRSTIRERYFDERTSVEIATRRGETPAAIRQQVHRGLTLLRDRLDGDEREAGRAGWLASFVAGLRFDRPAAVSTSATLVISVALGLCLFTAMLEPEGAPRGTVARTPDAPDAGALSRRSFGAGTARRELGARESTPAAGATLSVPAASAFEALTGPIASPGEDDRGGGLEPGDHFGRSIVALGDTNGDGSDEFLVGADGGQHSGAASGSVWIVSIDDHNTLSVNAVIRSGENGFEGHALAGPELFGYATARVGDLDGDGVSEIAVGAPNFGTTFNTSNEGAVWILFLRADFTVQREVRITPSECEAFDWIPGANDNFGNSLAALGDLDGDGTVDLAVGTHDAGDERGEVAILFLRPDGSCRATRRIASGLGGFSGELRVGDHFGRGLAAIGDLDGDGVSDLVVGAPGDDTFAADAGAIWVLRLAADGRVRGEHRILPNAHPFPAIDWRDGALGGSLEAPGDLDGDGIPDLLSISHRGSVALSLRRDGSVRATTWNVPPGPAAVRGVSDGGLRLVLGHPNHDEKRGGVFFRTLPLEWHDSPLSAEEQRAAGRR